MEDKKDTKFDAIVKWAKNKPFIVVILAFVGVVSVVANLLNDGKSILSAFSNDQVLTGSQDTISGKNESESRQPTPRERKVKKSKATTYAPISVKDNDGDVVISQGQTGGITAHTVNINKPEQRTIKSSLDSILSELKKHPSVAYRLHYSSSDLEASELANELDGVLQKSNWQKINPIVRLGRPPFPKGITLYMIKQDEGIIALNNQLWIALQNKGVEGQVLTEMENIFTIHGNDPIRLPNNRNGVVIFIGPHPDN